MKRLRLSIYHKVILILLIVGLTPAALGVLLTARELWNVAINVAGNDIQTQAGNIAGLVNADLSALLDSHTSATVDRPDVVELFFVRDYSTSASVAPPVDSPSTSPVRPRAEPPDILAGLFAPQTGSTSTSGTLFLVPATGPYQVFYSDPATTALRSAMPNDYRFIEARRMSFREGLVALSVHTAPATFKPTAMAWLPIPPRDPLHAMGWLAHEIEVGAFLRGEASRTLLGVDGACIVTYSGYQLADVGMPPSWAGQIVGRLAEASEPGGSGYFEIDLEDGSRQLVGYSPIPLTRALRSLGRSDALWYLCVSRDLQPLESNFWQQLSRDIMAGLVLAIVLSLVAYALARRLTRPILELERGVRRVADGESDIRVEIKTGDELEGLAQAFNEMADNIERAAREVSEQMATVRRQADELTLVHEISRAINARLDLDETLSTFARETGGVIAYDHLSVALLDDDAEHFTIQIAFPATGASEFAPGTRHHIEESDIGNAIRDGRPVVKRNIAHSPERALDDHLATIGFGSLMVVPLLSESKAIGSVILASRNPEGFGPEDQKRMAVLAEPVAVAIQHSRLYMRVRRFAEDLEEEVRRRTALLRRAQDKLVQTEKLAASGQLAAGIAHEINNPLGIIKNYLRLTMDRFRSGPGDESSKEVSQHLAVIEEEISRIARIVRNLLDIYHPGEHRPAPTDVQDLLERVLELFAHNWSKKGIEIKRDYAPDLPPAVVSPDRLRQVFINLLRNAEDAMPDGGSVSLSAELRAASAEPETDQIVVCVRDTGCGISNEDLQRVYDPFFTTKKGGSGTGLGLSIIYGIIRSWGGTIDIESEPGRGTCVSISIPVLTPAAEADDSSEQAEAE